MAEQETNVEEQEIVIETEAEVEEKVEVEEPEKEEPDKSSGDEELDSYSKGVQSRIKKLTEKYRQEERDKAEAVRLSQQLIEENKKLKTRVKSLDSGYLNEYGNRLESQTLSAKQMYKEAHESGDTDKMIEAQELISKIAVERQRYQSAKVKADQQAKMPVQQPQAQPKAVQEQQVPVKPDPKAQVWAEKNKWFGDNRVMTMAAFAINQQLIEEEGFDPQSDEYYTEIDSRIRSEFPHKFEAPKKSGGGSQVASAGNSASRKPHHTGRRSVKLSHSQVAIAKKLGVPLEEYAKYVKD
tara:strand:+ start:2820 stop:3710 length:891 start_codon:yes stop_codon:yes gene_type:complete